MRQQPKMSRSRMPVRTFIMGIEDQKTCDIYTLRRSSAGLTASNVLLKPAIVVMFMGADLRHLTSPHDWSQKKTVSLFTFFSFISPLLVAFPATSMCIGRAVHKVRSVNMIWRLI